MFVRIVVCLFLVTLAGAEAGYCDAGVECVELRNCTQLCSLVQEGLTFNLKKTLKSLHCGNKHSPTYCCPTDPDTLTPSSKYGFLHIFKSFLPGLDQCTTNTANIGKRIYLP